MPAASASRTPVTVLGVPAGAEGITLLARAVAAALDGGPAVALIPAYAPAAQRQHLHRRLTEDARTHLAALPPETAVVCPTSGSTGEPRLVVLSRSALLAAAAARDAAQGGPSAWFIALPPVTAATLIAVARSHRGTLPLSAWPGIGGAQRFSASSFTAAAAASLRRAGGAWATRTSLVPAQLARLLDDAAAVTVLRGFDTVLLGGGPAAPHLLERARSEGVNLTTTYGMTETCGGCVYDGVATPGTQVVLADDGEVLLGGDCLATGYLERPLTLRDGLLATGDRGRFDAAGRLEVLGRFDDVITVRGANVDLAAVTAIVASIEGVTEAAVVAEPDPLGGHVVVAHVVGPADPEVIRATVRDRLGVAAVPRIRPVDALPRLSGGKVDTQRLAKGPR